MSVCRFRVLLGPEIGWVAGLFALTLKDYAAVSANSGPLIDLEGIWELLI